MVFKTKKIIIIGIIFAVSIVVIALGLFWFFKNKPSDLVNSVQNSNNEISQLSADDNNKETKLSFDLNSKKDFYKIKKGDKWVYVLNGQEGLAYDQVSRLTFSSDGKKIAYSASLDKQTYLVVNNVSKAVSYEKINSIVFSPDGNRIAYVANNGRRFVIVLDDKAGKEYEEIGTLGTGNGEAFIIFSPDSQKIAYKVVTESGAFVVVNQQSGKIYTDITSFQFSDDSKQFAYQAERGTQEITVVNNSKEIINGNSETKSQNSTSTSGTYKTGSANSGSTSTKQVSSGASRTVSDQSNCKGSTGVIDCR